MSILLQLPQTQIESSDTRPLSHGARSGTQRQQPTSSETGPRRQPYRPRTGSPEPYPPDYMRVITDMDVREAEQIWKNFNKEWNEFNNCDVIQEQQLHDRYLGQKQGYEFQERDKRERERMPALIVQTTRGHQRSMRELREHMHELKEQNIRSLRDLTLSSAARQSVRDMCTLTKKWRREHDMFWLAFCNDMQRKLVSKGSG
ncbi:hypothetical protein FISHEDRAFT_59160 [Fistulina hepatica ATCC 64428]|uniref:Uncharacterized protein n=1 Tax=Fistulina hepatica ATCC 64428 TaxID=1128425 RepID=A0A0D7ABA6_9AGAR|nr:hypothetical protein FISHEDRAFT_59160 [Fistulina hepatica ATCC 64428]